MTKHLKRCPECRKIVAEIDHIMDEANAVKEEIQRAVDSVDWDGLPARITDYVFEKAAPPDKFSRLGRFKALLLQPKLKPVMAGLFLGLLIGSFAMYLALKDSGSTASAGGSGFFASREFLDRVELEMARRETLDYLQKSQYILLDFVEAPAGHLAERAAFGSAQAKELLSKKKYLNTQLDKYQMAKAKAICDQIELLFLELAQISEELSDAELEYIRSLIRDRRLLLKINLVRKELEESEV